ncbi:MAG: ComEC/Rec2 family competence protein [Anaerolineales bacterium]
MQSADSSPRSRFDDLAARLPLTWLSLAFLGGILLADWQGASLTLWLMLAGGAAVLAALARFVLPRLMRRPAGGAPAIWFLLALALVAGFLGAARYRASVPANTPHYITWFADRPEDLLVTGVVAAPPDVRDRYINLRLEVRFVNSGYGDIPVEGLILARLAPGGEYHYGQVLRLRGQLLTPPEEEAFSYRDYLARQGVRAYMPSATVTLLPLPPAGNPVLGVIYAFKERCLAHVYRLFPDPEASLLAGILLGQDNGLPADLQEAFKNTGTAHIIAISGFNIAIIAGLFMTLFGRLFGPRRGTLAAVVGIALYTVLVGAEPAVVRAAIMGGLGLFARQVGRRQTALNTLTFTGALMALINPNILWEVGFQLSFFATLGLILYAQPFQDWTVRLLGRAARPSLATRLAQPLSEFVLFTLAAQLTTLPIMAYHFQRISVVSLIANPFILPVQPAVMILGGLALLLSFVYFPIGQLAAWAAWPFPAYTIRAVELFDRLPHGTIVLGDFSLLFVLVFYALLFGWTFSRERLRRALRPALTPTVLLGALAILNLLTFRAALLLPDGRLHVTFLDVDGGEAILIRTPSGRHVLVNGGSSASRLSDALGRRLPLYERELDYLLLTSTRQTDLAALPDVLDRFPPRAVLWSGRRDASTAARQLERWLTEYDIPIEYAAPGQSLDLGAGARLEVLTVTPRGAVLLLTWEGFRLVLPGGLNFAALEELQYGADLGPVSVLSLAESGYAPANPPEWIANLRPQLAVLSVAAGDSSGLPDDAVLQSLRGYTLLRTDQDGWIEVVTDGRQMWAQTER